MRDKVLLYLLALGLVFGSLTCTSAALAADPSAPPPPGNGLLELPSLPNVSVPSTPAATPTPSAPAPVATAPTPPATTPTPPAATPPAATTAASQPAATAPPPSPASPAAAPASSPPAAAASAPSLPSVPVNPNPPVTVSSVPAPDLKTQNIDLKNPETLFEPPHMGGISMMFSKKEIDVINPFLEAYDNAMHSQVAAGGSDQDELNALLDTIKHNAEQNSTATTLNKAGGQPDQPPPPLPNIYLGSIVYYTPGYWSVWINGKKLVNKKNKPNQEFYVSQISRSQMELIWKPPSLNDLPKRWREKTDNGANPPPGITLDQAKGAIILRMRPNQTFLPRSLAIREGLIKSPPMPVTNPANNTANTDSSAPNMPIPVPAQNAPPAAAAAAAATQPVTPPVSSVEPQILTPHSLIQGLHP